MKISVTFEPQEIQAVQDLVAAKVKSGRRMMQFRLRNNVEGEPALIDNERLWWAHMMCLLTTQQRSGPGSPINRLLYQRPFSLDVATCRSAADLEQMIYTRLTSAGGIRRTNKVARATRLNFQWFEDGGWSKLHEWCERLREQRCLPPHPSHRLLEEEASDFVDQWVEFGPKQARNFWQELGLTRYVFVLDSRIIGWLKKNIKLETGFLTSQGLSDPTYYQFVSDLLMQLCTQADVLPCMFDAALFDSVDEGKEWGEGVLSNN